MTFGPWLAALPAVVEVAGVEGFFQKILGWPSSVAAFASTTTVFAAGLDGSVVPGTRPASQTSLPPSMRAPSPVATRVKLMPAAGGTVTVPPSAGVAWKLRTRSVSGKVSPGLTQPFAETKEFSSTGPAGAAATAAREPAPSPAAR